MSSWQILVDAVEPGQKKAINFTFGKFSVISNILWAEGICIIERNIFQMLNVQTQVCIVIFTSPRLASLLQLVWLLVRQTEDDTLKRSVLYLFY